MFKKFRKNEKGFTLAELLIVVAIIGVLVAVSIPIFTNQLEKARDAVSVANIRTAYAEAQTLALTGTDGETADKAEYKKAASGFTVEVKDVAIKGKKASDDYSGLAAELPFDHTKVADQDGPITKVIVFTYNNDGELQSVAWQ